MTWFCKTCFDNDKPRSPDLRYCRGCYETWLMLSSELSPPEKAKWVPQVGDTPVKPQQPLPGLQQGVLTHSGAVQERKGTRGRHRLFLDKQARGILNDFPLKTRDVAEKLGISKSTVANLRKNGGGNHATD